ncbi:LysR family transcriptional regulator [Alishewanella longhuensis]|uniref:LysR family transcriptional regulator n=1 Tax=Alishewanella longhuensis TaxID=1091037 RepID=A0ABQ3L4M1_9ALTE|nr:LysR family transcriptional regulator [Alishewanella longhuensis]GHG77300.1 LysR family transcriptional regulator [Alishewanella longhuensis]
MDQRHLSFRLLQVFRQVVQSGSITGASRLLHLTQPTVSLQLKKLSEVIGEPLFYYQQHKLQLTAAGELLYQTAQDIDERLTELSQQLKQQRTGNSGTISLAVVNTAQYLLPQILAAFDHAYPAVQVTLHIGNRARILERFEQQQDHLYLFSHPPRGDNVHARSVVPNPLYIVAPREHWAAKADSLRFEQLTHERFLLREPGSATRMTFDAWLSSQATELHHSMQMETNEAIRLSVIAGLGLAVLSAHTLPPATLLRQQLAVLKVAGFPLSSHWYLVQHANKRLPQAALKLQHFIEQHLSDWQDPLQQ